MSESLFITGASGFIGSHVLRRIDATDFERIYCLSRNGGDAIDALSRHPNVFDLRGDLLKPESYREHLEQSSVVLHLAAVTGKARRRAYFETNAEGTAKLIDSFRAAGGGRFVLASTIAVKYADTTRYHYAHSKLEAERIVRDSGIPYVILRPTIVLGPRAPGWQAMRKMAAARVMLLPGTGRVVVQPIHVDDLVACILRVVADQTITNETLDLGGPDRLSVEEFLRRIHRRVHGREPRVVHLPLRVMRSMLGIAEFALLPLLPITAGQLALFRNDGLADENEAFGRGQRSLISVDDTIATLVADNGNDAR